MIVIDSEVLQRNMALLILIPVMCSVVVSMVSVLAWRHGSKLFVSGDFGPMARSIRRAGSVSLGLDEGRLSCKMASVGGGCV